MRILVDLPQDDLEWLDAQARSEGRSRAALIREAIALKRRRDDKQAMAQYFGLWARHGSTVDGLAYEQALRDEWPRLQRSGEDEDRRAAA